MQTRLSKIARLPAHIRQELNLRLNNGQLGRKILPWVNNLPETKEVLAENFDAKPITHQNLSEWRRAGYQDWLQQQERKEWFNTLTEHDNELDNHDQCGDAYEAMSRFFLVEVGQAFTEMKNIKNSDARFTRLQNLTREFARLQNAYNWSRRVAIDWEKYNDQCPPEPEEPESCEQPDDSDHALANGDRARPGRSETRPRGSHLGSETFERRVLPPAPDVRREVHRTAVEATALPENSDQPPDPTESPAPVPLVVARASCPCESPGRDARAITEACQNPSPANATANDLPTPNCDL